MNICKISCLLELSVSTNFMMKDMSGGGFFCLLVSYHRITQNHRMFGVGRDLWGSSSPTVLPKQGHLEQVAQDFVQVDFEYLQRRSLHNVPGQPVPVLCHSQDKEVLLCVQLELPVLQFVPIATCPVTGHH